MTKETIVFNGRNFTIYKDVYVKGAGLCTIASESLGEALLDEDYAYVSDEAKDIDETIFFYVPDEILSQDNIGHYVYERITYPIKISTDRAEVIINNLVVDLLDKCDFPEEQLVSYLETEIGMTQKEMGAIKILTRRGLIA